MLMRQSIIMMLSRKTSLGHSVGLMSSVEKNKGRLYGTRELGKSYIARRGIHKQQPSFSSSVDEVVNRLT